MKAVIIADAHVKGAGDPVQDALVKFIDGLSGLDMLIILGDLFDFWMGCFPIEAYARYAPILEALKRLKERGVGIVYLEGNHDIYMGPYFTETIGAKVYANFAVLEMDGKKVFFSHGDAAAAGFAHSIWRFISRSFLMRLLAKTLGPKATFDIGSKLSTTSRGYNNERAPVEEALRRNAKIQIGSGADAAVYAHSHSAAVLAVKGRSGDGIYANPGSFAGDGTYLVYENRAFYVKKTV